MIINQGKGGKNTKDATIEAKDVMYGEVAYGKDGRIVGEAPLSFVNVSNGTSTYNLENTTSGMNITAENCDPRHIIVKDNKVTFEDEPTIITSTTEVTEGSASNYPENSLYVVYKEG